MEKNCMVNRCKHMLATFLFLFVLMLGTVCFAEEIPGTVLGDSCNIRATADASGTVIGNAKKGANVSICGETTGTDGKVWYQIYVDANTKGYILSDLVKKSDGGAAQATASANLPETQATPVDSKSATVTTNGVRIRKGASKQYDYVATANKGMTLTVTGEASGDDGQTWYQVSFDYNGKQITGFIRNDLVTFGSVASETVSSEITGTTENPTPEETPQPEEAAEGGEMQEPQEQPAEEQQQSSNDNANNMILMNVSETPYLMPGFTPIILKWEDQDINAYKNGSFYIFYAQNQSGQQGWYVFDSSEGTYQRYAYTVEGVTSESADGNGYGMLPVIILAVIIVILLVVIGLLFIRLREYTSEEYDEEEDEEEEEEIVEIEEEAPVRERTPRRKMRKPLVEEQLEEIEEEPVRRPQERPQRPRPQENPQRQRMANRPQQPVRRPEEQQVHNRPVESRGPKRPEGSTPVRREGERPVRNANGEEMRRRPEGMRQTQPKKPSGQGNQRRPQSQRPEQRGYKAQNFIENDDQNDLEFIDL